MLIVWLLCLTILTQAHSKNVNGDKKIKLKWPETATFIATKLQLINGRKEEFHVWQNGTNQRIDKGVTRSYILDGVVYYYHPETTEYYLNDVTCFVKYKTEESEASPLNVLPNVKSHTFTFVGKEPIRDHNTMKFTYKINRKSREARSTIWAEYDKTKKIWIPFRNEYIIFDDQTGAVLKHNIWEFSNFNTSFDLSIWETEDNSSCIETSDLDAPFIDVVKTGYSYITHRNEKHLSKSFSHYKQKFGKKYGHKKEHDERKKIYEQNLKLVISVNSQNLGYKLAMNNFADRTPEEMARRTGLKNQHLRTKGNIPFPYSKKQIDALSDDLPLEYDLRTSGLVGSIKDQGDCGSCWSFAVTAAAEGALAKTNGGRLLTLSNQALIDCAWAKTVQGCNGGLDTGAYKWMVDYGLPTEEEYGPYLNGDGECHIENVTTMYSIRGFTDVTPFNNKAMKIALINHGPLSVSVNVNTAFSLYAGGIFQDLTCDSLSTNHAVTLVGYGEQDGEEFWIIKNSWGDAWGMDGFIHMSVKNGACGVASSPTYPVF